MKAKRLARDEKLSQRCSVLASVVLALRPLYQKASVTETQKEFLETIIGAAIWYLPDLPELFTGKMSVSARDVCNKDPKQWAKLTKEHFFPRKRAGADLLQEIVTELTGEEILNRYKTKYGRYNRVTKIENRALVSSQRKGMSAEECYPGARIDLIDVPPELMNRRPKKKVL
jgi:hypothetical protein